MLKMEYETAKKFARSVLNTDSKHHIAIAVMANVIFFGSEHGHYPIESIKYFQQSLDLQFNDWGDYVREDYDEMVFISLKNLFIKYVNKGNSNYDMNQKYADYCFKHKKYKEALKGYKEAIKGHSVVRKRKQHYNHRYLSVCYHKIEDFHGAIKYVLLALDYRSEDVDYLSDLGLFYYKTNQYKKAIQYLEKANECIGNREWNTKEVINQSYENNRIIIESYKKLWDF
eukprot:115592_1